MTVQTWDDSGGGVALASPEWQAWQDAVAQGDAPAAMSAAGELIRAADRTVTAVIGQVLLAVSETDDDGTSILSRSGYTGSLADWCASELGAAYTKAHVSNVLLTAKAARMAGVPLGERAARALRPLVRSAD